MSLISVRHIPHCTKEHIHRAANIHSEAPDRISYCGLRSRFEQSGASIVMADLQQFHSEDELDVHLANEEHEAADSGRDSSGPDEAVFDKRFADGDSSPGTSHNSDDDDVSELPESRRTSYLPSGEHQTTPLTPTKQRSPFRKPSSVRAMQLDTTPPHLMSSAQHQRYRMSNVSQRSTPKSSRSYHSVMRSGRSSPTKAAKKEYPLVLLHVTLLPVSCPYSSVLMEAVLPPHIIENWKLLNEKVSVTMIDRGILIPHPREDYDLLVERLLESLELKAPRILQCGHFHLTPEEEADIEASEDEYDSDGEYEICQDCGRRIRDGRFGAGAGERRWSVKVYASNGLMRAGAWGAAWREMERVDVEILPWIEDDLRRQLELGAEDAARQQFTEPPAQSSQQTMDEARRREIYGEEAEQFMNTVHSEHPADSRSHFQQRPEVPLSELLRNYLYHLFQDRKNFAILALSLCVIYLAARIGPVTPASTPAASHISQNGAKPLLSTDVWHEGFPVADVSTSSSSMAVDLATDTAEPAEVTVHEAVTEKEVLRDPDTAEEGADSIQDIIDRIRNEVDNVM